MSGTLARILRPLGGPLAAIALVSAAMAALGGLALPALDHLASVSTRADLGRALQTERDVQVRFPVAAPDGADPQRAFDGLERDLRRVRSDMPTDLRRSTGTPGFVAATPYLILAPEPSKVPAAVMLSADPAFASRVRWADGRAPRVTDGPALEIALSTSAVRAIGWPVGTERTVTDPSGAGVALRLVGVYEAVRRQDPAWAYEPLSLQSRAVPLERSQTVKLDRQDYAGGNAFVAPDAFGTVAGHGWFAQGQAWFPLRADAVRAADRAGLATATRSFTGRSRTLPSLAQSLVRPSTGLPGLLDDSLARDRTVRTLAAAAASGPAAAAIALQVLLARLVLTRERDRWLLLAARGAGRAWSGLLAAGLVGLVAVPGAVVGAVLALVGASVIGGPGGVPGGVAPVGLAALLAVAVPCAAVAVLVPRPSMRPRARWVRVVAESATAVVTVVAAVVTARDGVATAAPGGTVDPLAALLPVLVPVLGVVVAVRVLPVVLRPVAARAARRRSVAPLGLTAAGRNGGGGGLPLAAATIGIAVALFASVLGSTLVHGLGDAARRTVGADVSVTGAGFDEGQVARLGRVPGVGSIVGVSTSDTVTVDSRTGSRTAVVIVADTAALRRVQAGGAGSVDLPAALSDRGGAVPVLMSRSLARSVGARSDGARSDGARGTVLGTAVRGVGTAPDASTFTPARDWLLVDAARADEITFTGSVDRVLVRVAPGHGVAAVAAALRDRPGVTRVTTASAVARGLTADPRVPGTQVVAVLAVVTGAGAGVGALCVAAVLAGPRRRREDALLGRFGAGRRDRRRVVLAEELPALVTAVVTAVVAAAVTVALTVPAADLRSFTGDTVRPGIALDPVLLAVVGLGVVASLVLVAALAVGAGTTTTHRVRHRPPRTTSRPRRVGP